MQNLGLSIKWACWAVVVLVFAPFLKPQEQTGDEALRTREMWDTSLLSKRPAGHKVIATKPSSKDDALVGITVWRLRASQSGDDPAVRELLHEDNETRQFTPERISAKTALHEGEKVRISIEAVRRGYLYVVDHEVYADGTRGEEYLIFPTLRLRGGDNRVKAGTVVEIPSMDDSPPFFRVRRSRSDQTTELLTIIVSPKPIEQVQIGRERLRLSGQQVAAWEKDWKTQTYQLETPGLAGKPSTSAEKAAGSSGKILTQDDPVPQTMYHCDVKSGDPLLVELPLRISK
jgi:hypothetical protein